MTTTSPDRTGEQSYVDLVRRAIDARGSVIVHSVGTSMVPAISSGDKLTVRRADFAEVSVGDVIASVLVGKIIIHRVVWRTSVEIVTAGDNLHLLDPPTHEQSLLGIVDRVSPLGVPVERPQLPRLDLPVATEMVVPFERETEARRLLAATGSSIYLRALRSSDVHGFDRTDATVGVSSAGKCAPGSLRDAIMKRRLQATILVGWTFGMRNLGPANILDPSVADSHVRLRRDPHIDVPFDIAFREVVSTIRSAIEETQASEGAVL